MSVTTAGLSPCSILLLCGGQGRRVGGADKGLLPWRGRPLVAWLVEALREETDDLLVSCNRHLDVYAHYGDRVLNDAQPGHAGPLAGIRQGLLQCRHECLIVLPCDAPQVDTTLTNALRRCARLHPDRAVLLTQAGQAQPLFSLWPRTLLPRLEDAWAAGERSPLAFLRAHGAVSLPWQGPPQLANLNTLELLHAG